MSTAVRAGRVVDVARELGITVSPQQVVTHYGRHRPEQPAFTGGDRMSLILQANELTHRQRNLLLGLARRRVMTMSQIIDVFYADTSADYGKRQARRNLGYLMHQGFIYRYFADTSDARAVEPKATVKPENEKHITKKTRGEQMREGLGIHVATQPFYFLGKAAVPFVEEATGTTLYEGVDYMQSATQTGQASLPHDIRANELYCSLVRSLRAKSNVVRFGKHYQEAHVLDADGAPSNWYGPRALPLYYYDRTQLVDDEIRPDGLIALDLPKSPYRDGGPSTQVPFFVEFDRGSRKMPEVRQQLLAYHRMSLAGAAGKRFPQLAAPGYSVPVLMVFSDRTRMENVRRHLRRDAEAAGLVRLGNRGAPVLLAVENEWNADPFATGIIYDAWEIDGHGHDFLRLLTTVSRPLVAVSYERGLAPGRPLRVDPDGAKPKARGYFDADRRMTARERDAEAKRKRKRVAAEDEALREKYGVAPAATA